MKIFKYEADIQKIELENMNKNTILSQDLNIPQPEDKIHNCYNIMLSGLYEEINTLEECNKKILKTMNSLEDKNRRISENNETLKKE